MTWILTLVLIHAATADTIIVPGFASEAECRRVGQDWVAKINRRDENADVPVFRCERKERKQ